MGLGSSILPSTALGEIFTEEDLEAYLMAKEAEDAQEDAQEEPTHEDQGHRQDRTGFARTDEAGDANIEIYSEASNDERDAEAVEEAEAEAKAETEAEAETETEAEAIAVTETAAETQHAPLKMKPFQEIRASADQGQSKAAARMTRCGNHLLRPLSIGQCATLGIPNVDRGPTDPKNMLVVVLKEQDGLYTVGCREGILGPKYTAADLSAIDQPLIKAGDVPDVCLLL